MDRFSLWIIAFLVSVAAPLQAQIEQDNFFAELRSANEVPAANSPAVGAAFVTIDANDLMTYEVSIIGMSGTPSLAQIYENVSGLNGPAVVTFPISATDVHVRRVSGKVQADVELAKRIRTNPQTFYLNVHSDAFPNGEIRGQLLGANEENIAVAGNITTGVGDRFVTDLRIFNPTKERVVALVEFFTRRADGIAVASKPVEIEPKGEAVLDDVVGPGFLNAAEQIGALRITSHAFIAPTAKIYLDRNRTNQGTLGQFVPAVPLRGASAHGAIPHLSNHDRDLSNPEGSRANIGFFNPNQDSADVALTLRDAGGNVVGTTTLQLGPVSQLQVPIGPFFPAADLRNATALTLEYDAARPIVAYGSVNDNVSGDPIYIPAQSVPNVN